MKEKILVVDDEQDILNLVEYNLKKEGYRVTCVETGEEALDSAKSILPDLIILDLMLPGVDGIDVCKILKQDKDTAHIPIIMLTAKGEESDIVTGLEMGADDYITKPFSPRVLTARIKTGLRREKKKVITNDHQTIRIHDIIIDPGKHKVHVDGKELDLTYSEFRLLQTLVQRPGWVFSRYQIVEALRGDDYPVTERAVDVQIVGLRKKLGKYGKMIETVRGVGYRFSESTTSWKE
jgi:two-component system, OmpR family, alkaline phosphatase synthesis response regulator PhoP